MSDRINRALLLMQHNRPDQAENELRAALVDDPSNGMAHSLLGMCLSHTERLDEALRETAEGIRCAPDSAYAHYARAVVALRSRNPAEAERALNQAIRLDPTQATYYGLRAGLHAERQQWSEMLAAAEEGLRHDPENESCINYQTTALRQLGRFAEAQQRGAEALAQHPDSAWAHATAGWNRLEAGDPQGALERFREALRLEPELDLARSGMVEALKARHFVYRQVLRFFLFMSKLSGGAQWALILGFVFGVRVLRSIARANPALAPFIAPVIFLYIGFVLLTWLADPLFNLALRFNRYGRWALRRDQIRASNWIAGCIALGVVSAIAGLATNLVGLLLAGVACALLLIPIAATFQQQRGWPRWVMGGATALLAAIGLGASAGAVYAQATGAADIPGYVGAAFTVVGLGAMLSTYASLALRRATIGRLEPDE